MWNHRYDTPTYVYGTEPNSFLVAAARDIHAVVVAGLKPGGVFILEAYTPRQLEYGTGGPKSPDLLVTLEELRDDLTGLRLLHAVEKEESIVEGELHTGLAHVVQVSGVKG